MRTHLTQSTHLFALLSMCYLPEWNIVNNNNKYTQNINGDINGMLTVTNTQLIKLRNLLRFWPQDSSCVLLLCTINILRSSNDDSKRGAKLITDDPKGIIYTNLMMLTVQAILTPILQS